jgi:hypothetical protein
MEGIVLMQDAKAISNYSQMPNSWPDEVNYNMLWFRIFSTADQEQEQVLARRNFIAKLLPS